METKHSKNSGVTFFALAFIVALLFELYFILNDPTNYFMLIGIGIILVITGYLTFDGLERAKIQRDKAVAEQNDLMIKAGKAIYLATKRNSQEAEKQHVQNIKAIEIMMNKLMSNEKEMVNALIAQNEEIAAKQLTTSAPSPSENNQTDMSSLIEQLSASNAKLAKEVQSAITVNELVKANADLVRNVREVLNNSSGLSSDTISSYVANAVPEIKLQPSAGSINTPVSPATPTATMNVPVTPDMNITTPVVPNMNISSNTATPVSSAMTNTMDTASNLGTSDSVSSTNTTSDDFGSLNDIMNGLLSEDADDNAFSFNANASTSDANMDVNYAESTIDDDFELDENFNITNGTGDDDSLDGFDQKMADEFDFVSFDIADNTSDTVLDNGDAVSPQEIVDDINISTLNEMVEEEGSVIAPAISKELDEEMSQGEAESVLSGLEENPNRQLTEAEIAALFANL